jgi:hypothetical protein
MGDLKRTKNHFFLFLTFPTTGDFTNHEVTGPQLQ